MTVRVSVALAALLLLPAIVAAQSGTFGRNKIQYRHFEWQILRGEHIDLYFYPEEHELARVALVYAEESFQVLERKLGHTPTERIPLIIYASHADFEQTNVLPFVPPEELLGVTEFLKRRVAVPFKGNYSEFRHTLRHELVHSFQLSLLAELEQRDGRGARVRIPLWWTEGLAEYWSGGEDTQDEMVLRALTISGRLPRLGELSDVTGGIVYPIGGAIHRWLGERYGEWRVQQLYHDLWKYRSFDEALLDVYGESRERLENQLRYHFQRRYYPTVQARRPVDVIAEELASVAIRPVAYRLPGDSTTRFLFLSPSTGYMNVYAAGWDRPGEQRVVVKGERSAQFESLHSLASRLDVRDGIAVFSSKYLERDAIFFWDLERAAVVGRYQFPSLVSLLSPAWSPDGGSVVFSGLSEAGYSDLYRLHLDGRELEQLTFDRFEDTDPSVAPDGRRVVFSSDRTADGADGARNLYLLDVATSEIEPLTHGAWRDETPRWASNDRIYFASDRDGVFDVYSVDSTGAGRRETRTLSGAFDPQWVAEENALLFAGFDDYTFKIFVTRPQHDSAPADTVLPVVAGAETGWAWPELAAGEYAKGEPVPYESGWSLDVAAGDALVAPGLGAAQGAVLLFSDLLSDQLLYLSATSFQAPDLGGLFDNLSASAFYLNRTRRLNWGMGAFRLRGLFFENDVSTVFEETAFGGFAVARWPFSRFSRVEGELRIERSDRHDLAGPFEDDPRRVGWLASNSVSYVHDNSLWLATGPIDGLRTNVTVGVTNDLTNGRFDAWTLSLDHRRYVRLGLRAAYAVRAFGYYTGGSRPRRISVGGPWGLRGYPRIGRVAGTRAFLLNQEVRFPLTDFIAVGFPFGEVRLPAVQGAVFADLGSASTPRTHERGVLGSYGLGLRMSLGFPLVIRLDLGRRFEFGPTAGYLLGTTSRGRGFVDFFFGFNY